MSTLGRSLRTLVVSFIVTIAISRSIGATEIIQYEYDVLFRLSTACFVLQDRLVTFTYDPAGNRTSATTTNGPCGATTFSIETPPAVLAGTALSFTVRRHGSTSVANTVTYNTANGTAVAGTNYAAASGNLTFNVGETARSVVVNTVSGSISSGSRTLFLNLSNPSGGATISVSQATGTINANTAFRIEAPAPVIAGNTLNFTVRRVGATGGANAISYATANGTAVAGTHYTAKSGTVSFAAGETVKTVPVNTITDSVLTGSRSMYVNLSNPTNGASIDTAQATGVINARPNSPPVAVNDSHYGIYYVFQSVPVYVRANDYDPDGDPITITSATCLSTGCSVSVVNGQYLMVTGTTPISKQVRYWISDGRGGTANAVATVAEFFTGDPGGPGCGEFWC